MAVNSELGSPLQVSSSGQVSVRRVLKLVLLRLSEAANSVQELQLPVLSNELASAQLALKNELVSVRQEPKPD